MQTRCAKNRRSLAAWLDLSEPERQRLREHARACAPCRGELERTVAVIEGLETGRQAYRQLRYEGPRPDFRAQAVLAPATLAVPRRGFWRPLPVAVAGGLGAVSLAIFLLTASLPPTSTPAPAPRPAPIAGAAGEPGERPRAGPPSLRPSAASASLEAIRREASRLRKPTAPRRPSGLGLRLPSRPVRPRPATGEQE